MSHRVYSMCNIQQYASEPSKHSRIYESYPFTFEFQFFFLLQCTYRVYPEEELKLVV